MPENRYLRDKAMRRRDMRNPYGSRGGYVRDRRSDYGGDMRNDYRDYGREDYAMGQDNRDYGRNDYRRDYNDYRDYRDYDMYDRDYKMAKKEYEESLEKWIEKLKRKDKYNMSYSQVIEQAKKHDVKFKEYTELEFYATYLAMVSDYKEVGNDPTMFIKMAKAFLEDDDAMLEGSEKLCAYLEVIVLGKKE